MKLIHNGKKTRAFYKLQECAGSIGAEVTKRGRGFTDYDILRDLIRERLVETRATGPRGGTRYHATDAGIQALKEMGS